MFKQLFKVQQLSYFKSTTLLGNCIVPANNCSNNKSIAQLTKNYHTYDEQPKLRATTILCVRKNNKVVLMGDGQVSLGNTIVKPNTRKVRKLKEKDLLHDAIIAGFAGSTADALTLFERLDAKLDEHPGQLLRSCVELAKNWRTDKYLRNLSAVMLVASKDVSLYLGGNGDVLEPYADVMAIGSGGAYAQAAARALMPIEGLDAEEIAKRAMQVAADICVFTNDNFTTEVIDYSNKDETAKVETDSKDSK